MGQSYKIGQDVIRFLETIIDSLRNSEVITNWTDNGDGTYTADTINTFDLVAGSAVLLDEAQFQDAEGDPEPKRVTSVVADTSFTVEATALPTVTSYKEAKPFFFYGTPKTINKTMIAIDKDDLKFPAIALIKTFPEDVDINPRALAGTMPTIELAFVTPSNFEDWDIDKIHDEAIRPMRQLSESFVDEVKRSPSIVHNMLNGYAIEDRPDIGVYIIDQGNESHIFAARTSGVILQITIPITKRFCKEAEGDDTLSIQPCAGVTIYESDGNTVDQVIPSGGSYTKSGNEVGAIFNFDEDQEDVIDTASWPASIAGTYDTVVTSTNIDSWSIVIDGGSPIAAVPFTIEAGDTVVFTVVRTTGGTESNIEFEGDKA